MAADKTFVLGLGAQKAATSWVHRYLRRLPEADFGAIKEYHVWDALRVPEFGYFSPLTPLARAKSLVRLATGGNARPDALRRRFCRDTKAYFDYFAELLDRDGIRLTGDITPSYGALPAETLREIRAGFDARGIPIRAFFLMRDPVERCHSAVRMHKRDGKPREGVDIRLDEDEALRRYVTGAEARLRTEYHHTLAAIDAVFDADEVFFGFYETIFTEPEVERLSAFFGVAPDLDFVEHKVNVSSKAKGSRPRRRPSCARPMARSTPPAPSASPSPERFWRGPEAAAG